MNRTSPRPRGIRVGLAASTGSYYDLPKYEMASPNSLRRTHQCYTTDILLFVDSYRMYCEHLARQKISMVHGQPIDTTLHHWIRSFLLLIHPSIDRTTIGL